MQADLLKSCRLFERALAHLPQPATDFTQHIGGEPGLGDSASVQFKESKTTISFYYAAMIGGPTPSPRHHVIDGPSPVRGVYQAENGSTFRVHVTPEFQQEVLKFLESCSHEWNGEKVRAHINELFPIEPPPGAKLLFGKPANS